MNKSVPSRKNTKLRNLTINQFEISAVTESVTDRRSHDGPSCMFVMNIREVAEETCSAVTESVTDCRSHDDPSCMFIMKIREVAEETCKYHTTWVFQIIT